MLLSDFPVLFKADLIFKDFLRKTSKFKYSQACANPVIAQIGYKMVLLWLPKFSYNGIL